MSIQSTFNEQAIESLGEAINGWIAAQDSHHGSQVSVMAVRFVAETFQMNYKAMECFSRTCDAWFRHSAGYLSYSKWYQQQRGQAFNGDENAGYSFTIANYNDQSYEWHSKL